MSWIGSTIIGAIIATLIGVVTWAYRFRRPGAPPFFFIPVYGGTLISLAVAFGAGLTGHQPMEAFVAMLVVVGTSVQTLLELRGRDKSLLIADDDARDAARAAGWGLLLSAGLLAVVAVFLGDI